MPEVPVCEKCKKPIDEDNEKYVVLNKSTAKYKEDWLYAHADCAKKG